MAERALSQLLEPDLDDTSGGSVVITLGNFCLNISLLLYFLLYIPQIYHNCRYRQFNNLSLGFHTLFLLAALADMVYGFGRITQWQYRLISIVTLICIMIQHVQLLIYRRQSHSDRVIISLLTLIILFFLAFAIMIFIDQTKHAFLILCMGWVERVGYSFYAIPQLFKGVRDQCLNSMSAIFLWIAVVTSFCDTVSAWCLNWGPSSLYGAPITFVLTSILLSQYYYLTGKSVIQSRECLNE